ncbi:MAG: response regulator [Blautia sp.]|nr:response regulator [Blautia sp.]
MRIFIVDDEEIVIDWIKMVIERSEKDCEVIGSAGSGTMALTQIRDLQPDVVISDIRMPELDGLTLVEMLKDALEHTVFIMISGYQEFEYARRALHLKVLDYIDKPLNKNKLFGALEQAETVLKEGRAGSGSAEEQKEQSVVRRRELSEMFLRVLETGTEMQIIAGCESFLEELYRMGLNEVQLRDSCAKIVYMAMENMKERVPSWNHFRNVAPYHEIKEMEDIEEVRTYTSCMVNRLAKGLAVDEKAEGERNAAALLAYIETHYQEDISLQELAEFMNMSPASVSAYFKTHIGMSYIKYLTQFRIDKAMELLRNGEKAYEVGALVGYNDYRYFSQVFKKAVNMSPSEYRNRFRTK